MSDAGVELEAPISSNFAEALQAPPPPRAGFLLTLGVLVADGVCGNPIVPITGRILPPVLATALGVFCACFVVIPGLSAGHASVFARVRDAIAAPWFWIGFIALVLIESVFGALCASDSWENAILIRVAWALAPMALSFSLALAEWRAGRSHRAYCILLYVVAAASALGILVRLSEAMMESRVRY